MIALDSVDHTLADVRDFNDVRHHDIEGVGKQKIGAGGYNAVFLTQHVDELIDRPGRVDLCEAVGVLVAHCKRLAIEDDFDILVTARARCTELVRAAQLHLT